MISARNRRSVVGTDDEILFKANPGEKSSADPSPCTVGTNDLRDQNPNVVVDNVVELTLMISARDE